MGKFEKVKNLLIYGGLTKEEHKSVSDEIAKYNRTSLLIYSSIASVVLFALFLITAINKDLVISQNNYTYICVASTTLIIALINKFFYNKCNVLLKITNLLFPAIFLSLGLLLAYKSKEDVSASYMVILFASPFFVLEPPALIIFLVSFLNTGYIVVMKKVQDPLLYSKDLVNSIVFCVSGLVVGTALIRSRVKRIYVDSINRKLMRTDGLTGLLNRRSYSEMCYTYMKGQLPSNLVCITFDLNKLKLINDTYGHAAGDKSIVAAASCIRAAFGNYGDIYRIGGDEFFATLRINKKDLDAAFEVFNSEIGKYNKTENENLSISSCYATVKDSNTGSFEALIHTADVRMYKNKTEFYKRLSNK